MTLIKSISGIRGTVGGAVGENLTPIDVVKFTTAYVRFMTEQNDGKRLTIVVGRDARISGEMVDDLIEGTLLGCGADVINVGLCTTPGTEMAVICNRADGGIIITASHNPRQWNALKLLNARGEFLNDAEGKRVLALAEDETSSTPRSTLSAASCRASPSMTNISAAYWRFLWSMRRRSRPANSRS